jgi:hypothetical protein
MEDLKEIFENKIPFAYLARNEGDFMPLPKT